MPTSHGEGCAARVHGLRGEMGIATVARPLPELVTDVGYTPGRSTSESRFLMGALALLFLLVGIIMNIKVLRGPLRARMTPQEIMRTQPWMISVVLIILGIALLFVAHA